MLNKSGDTSPVPSKVRAIALVLLTFLAGGIVLCGSVYYLLARPQYVELNIPHPQEEGVWIAAAHTSVKVRGDAGSFLVWRQETSVYGDEFDDGAAIIQHFDSWLENHGWKRARNKSTCRAFLHETIFLESDASVVYNRTGHPYDPTLPLVCLAVWRIDTESSSSSKPFSVVILTINATLLDRLNASINW